MGRGQRWRNGGEGRGGGKGGREGGEGRGGGKGRREGEEGRGGGKGRREREEGRGGGKGKGVCVCVCVWQRKSSTPFLTPFSSSHTISLSRTFTPFLIPVRTSTSLLLKRLHYLGVSYGLTQQLYNFWKKCGFEPLYLRQSASDTTGEEWGVDWDVWKVWSGVCGPSAERRNAKRTREVPHTFPNPSKRSKTLICPD